MLRARNGRHTGAPWPRIAMTLGLIVIVASLAGCTAVAGSAAGSAGPTPTPRAPTASQQIAPLAAPVGLSGDPASGSQLFVSTGCAGCHTLGGRGGPEAGATGLAGPILTNVVLRPTLAGESIPMSPETMTRWLLDPPAVKPGTTMPSVGLSEAEARDLTAYLYALAAAPQR